MHFKNLLSAPHWQSRLLMWAAAAAVGMAAVAFAKIADLAQFGLHRLLGVSGAMPWLLAPVGFFAIAWLTRRYATAISKLISPALYQSLADRYATPAS